jgi:hypothetical protein
MPKNRNTRSRKIARQNKARNSRSLPPVPRIVASPNQAQAALESVFTAQAFPMAVLDGQPRQVTLQHIADWLDADYAAKGEPPLEPGELAEILTHDVIFGRLRVRTDGLWESSQPYFTDGAEA